MNGKEILALPMQANDAGAATVRDYLIKLLALVWREDEEFDGKRPFGNSGWCRDLYEPLATAGVIETTIDRWNDVEIVDPRAADEIIADAIRTLS